MKTLRFTNNLFLNVLYNHLFFYPTPKNLNYLWSFGALSGLCLILQIITGLFLSMHYIPDINFAFLSVEHITRDINYGWLIRYLHGNGASMFFFVIFFHVARNFYFGSYLTPRISLWFSGIIIFFLLMATAFMGYVLPWGQMSFWGATVITNLFSAIPFYGSTIVEWLWGGFSVDQATLNRFYSLHFFLPFIISGIAFLHLGLLHEIGSSDPISLDSNKNFINPANITFFPYFFVKDLFSFFFCLLIFFLFIFFMPNILGHADNYITANSMVTPAHIVPEWYFLPFYAILRSIPNKLGGVIAMLLSIIGWFILPLFTPKYKSPKFKFFFSITLWCFFSNFIILGWIGQQPVELPFTTIGALSTSIYFGILFIILPLLYVGEGSKDATDFSYYKNKIRDFILGAYLFSTSLKIRCFSYLMKGTEKAWSDEKLSSDELGTWFRYITSDSESINLGSNTTPIIPPTVIVDGSLSPTISVPVIADGSLSPMISGSVIADGGGLSSTISVPVVADGSLSSTISVPIVADGGLSATISAEASVSSLSVGSSHIPTLDNSAGLPKLEISEKLSEISSLSSGSSVPEVPQGIDSPMVIVICVSILLVTVIICGTIIYFSSEKEPKNSNNTSKMEDNVGIKDKNMDSSAIIKNEVVDANTSCPAYQAGDDDIF